jgi:hypothetical protein
MNNDNDEDLLDTNRYTHDIGLQSGYGMTQEIRRFKLRKHIEDNSIYIGGEDPNADDSIIDNDLLKTNPVLDEDDVLRDYNKNRHVKMIRSVVNINSIQREVFDKTDVYPKNPETGLYTRDIIDENGDIQVQQFTSKTLNDEFEPGVDDYYEPYFRKTNGDIGIIKYKYRHPDEYIIDLPRTFTNVKEVKLISSEIPNTLNVINQLNNLIVLIIRDVDSGIRIPLKTGLTTFNYFIFQLYPGNYTLKELIKHMETTANELIESVTVEEHKNLMQLSVDENTSKISIKINDPPGRNLEFHWRFFFTHSLDDPDLPITQYSNLWQILGFFRPYEITTTGTDKYTKELTNEFNFGINPIIKDDVPDDLAEFQIIKPYRKPDLEPNKYIYLTIEGLNTIIDLQNPSTTNFKNYDLFAKIIFDILPGETAYNTFISNPKIFYETPLRILDRLKIKWVDYSGLPVDFNLRNHSFSIQITEYIDVLESNGYSTKRGTIDKTSATVVETTIIKQ